MNPPDNELLLRILAAVEKNDRNRWLEVASAFLLSFATLGSAWCAYEATLWGGVQTFRLARSTMAGRKGAEATIIAMQGRSVDAAMLIAYLEAQSRNDQSMQTFLHQRFRPEMKVAVDAWLKTDPLRNPAAPASPFKMAEYQQPELAEAKREDVIFSQEFASAQSANETSDAYVLLTVLFASVLFFAGIGGTFESSRLRSVVFVVAFLLFAATVISMGSMPICHE